MISPRPDQLGITASVLIAVVSASALACRTLEPPCMPVGAGGAPCSASVRDAGVALIDSGSVTVFDSRAEGDVAPIRVISGQRTGLRWPDRVAVDTRGYVYVTNGQINRKDDTVRVFAPDARGDEPPHHVIAGPHTGLNRPTGLGLDRKDRLYVGNWGTSAMSDSSSITVYQAQVMGDVKPYRTLAGGDRNGMNGPSRLIFDRQDSLYAKSHASVAVYAPGANGATEPVRHIERVTRGPQYRTVHSPQIFALDRHDTLYVVSGDTVNVFAPGYSGTEPAVRHIAGPQTGIHWVTDLALDERGWLYLAERNFQIRVYAPGASGDALPSRTIAGPKTRLSLSTGIALDRRGRLYVANGPPFPMKSGNKNVERDAPFIQGFDAWKRP
jgi:hypothetical protein